MRRGWIAGAAAAVVLSAACGGSGLHAAAAHSARDVCHQLKVSTPASNLEQAKAQLQRLSSRAKVAAREDQRWQSLSSALSEQYVAVAATLRSGSANPDLITKINETETQITKACQAADPGDAWGRSVFIPSDAMSPTIKSGDTVAFEPYRSQSKLRRGSIIVFRAPPSWSLGRADERLIKRVIALGGEHVVCCDSRGRITVDGKPLSETYLAPRTKASETPFDATVPPGRLWVMGDNRAGSADSRAHMSDDDGTIPTTAVLGIVTRIIAPSARARSITPPSY